MDVPIRTGDLHAAHRDRLAAMLRATSVFSDDEVSVAMELFDEATAGTGSGEAGSGEAGNGERGTGNGLPRVPSPLPVPGSPFPASPFLASPDYLFLGAFTPEDELVGYACYGPTPDADRTFDLYWIAVDPAAQGAGVGTLLLSEVERRLQGQLARLLVVETSSRSEYTPTRAFYAARGYHERARVHDFYAPGDDRIILTKTVPSPTRPRGGEPDHHE